MKTRKIITMLLVGAMTLSIPTNAYAASNGEEYQTAKMNSIDEDLSNLWINRDSFELIESSDDNRKFVSQFEVDNIKYQIDENINEDYSEVESKFYRLDSDGKKYLGEQETLINRSGENVTVTLLEDGSIIDVQNFTNPENNIENTQNNTNIPTPLAGTEYKWFSQGKYNGSNNIYRYTVAAIVGALSGAAGGAAASGLSALAGMIISEKWKVIYWTRETWCYMMRTPSSPLYPNWIQAGKYRYYTQYYSDSARKHLIRTTNYIDG